MRIHRGLFVLAALAAPLLLAACGNKGPLVLPDQQPPASRQPASVPPAAPVPSASAVR